MLATAIALAAVARMPRTIAMLVENEDHDNKREPYRENHQGMRDVLNSESLDLILIDSSILSTRGRRRTGTDDSMIDDGHGLITRGRRQLTVLNPGGHDTRRSPRDISNEHGPSQEKITTLRECVFQRRLLHAPTNDYSRQH